MSGWTMGTEAWIWMGAWALVMVLVVWLLVREPHREADEGPRAILRERFARGQISEEEFRRAAAALDAAPPPAHGDDIRPLSPHSSHPGPEARHD